VTLLRNSSIGALMRCRRRRSSKAAAITDIQAMLSNAVWAVVIRLRNFSGVRLGSALGTLIGRSAGVSRPRLGQDTLPQVKASWLRVGPTTMALVPGIAPAALAWDILGTRCRPSGNAPTCSYCTDSQ
jgi:hypothetical protein